MTVTTALVQIPVNLRPVARSVMLSELKRDRSGTAIREEDVIAAFEHLRARWLNPMSVVATA